MGAVSEAAKAHKREYNRKYMRTHKRNDSDAARRRKRDHNRLYMRSKREGNPEYRREMYRRENKENRRLYMKRYVKANPDKRRAHKWKFLYGLTPEDYNALLKAQAGVCATCLTLPQTGGRPLAVDHDHKTGKVRGLLCDHCNHALGRARDNTETLLRMVAYLRAEPQLDIGSKYYELEKP